MSLSGQLTTEQLQRFHNLQNKSDLNQNESREYINLRNQRLYNLLLIPPAQQDINQKKELELLQTQFLFDKTFGLGINKELNQKEVMDEVLQRLLKSDSKSDDYLISAKIFTPSTPIAFNSRLSPAPEDKNGNIFKSIIQAFKKLVRKEPFKNEKNSYTFSFSSEAKALQFCREQTLKGGKFRLENENNEILAYTKKDEDYLYGANGIKFDVNDKSFADPLSFDREQKRLIDLINKGKSKCTPEEQQEIQTLQRNFLFGTEQSQLGLSKNLSAEHLIRELATKWHTLENDQEKTPEAWHEFNVISAILLNHQLEPHSKPNEKLIPFRIKFEEQHFETQMNFPSEEAALKYCQCIANDRRYISLYTSDWQLIASSDGDGKLYNRDGKEIDPPSPYKPR